MNSLRMKTLTFALCFHLLLAACSHVESKIEHGSAKGRFILFLKTHPAEVFRPTIDQKVKNCLEAYSTRLKLPNGNSYGDSVRAYSLVNKTVDAVRSDMARMNCQFKEDVLRDPIENKPKFHNNQSIPLWVFLCSDGGVIRIKPQGDPTNPFRPQVHGSKALRYPYNSKFENFSDEVVKIDNDGNPIPKSRADLGPQSLADGWALDAHTDLGK